MNALKILTEKNLTISQVFNVVDNWYASYRAKNIGVIQSTCGVDLEEILYNSDSPFYYDGNVIEEYKLSEEEVLTLVSFWYNEIYLSEETFENYNLEFGLIETELNVNDLKILYGERIQKKFKDEMMFSEVENIDLIEYIDLEFLKIEEDISIREAVNNIPPLTIK
jgi:hypothetical protein